MASDREQESLRRKRARHVLAPTELDGVKVLAPAVAHAMVHWPEVPKLAEQMQVLIERVAEIRARAGGSLAEAREQVTAIVKREIQHRFGRTAARRDATAVLAKAGRIYGEALIERELARAELPFVLINDDGGGINGDHKGGGYELRLSILNVHCVEETTGLGVDEIAWTGTYSYLSPVKPLRSFRGEFDGGDIWPTGDTTYTLATIALQPGTKETFRNEHFVCEEDLMDPAGAELLSTILIGIATLGVSFGASALKGYVHGKIDDSGLTPEQKQDAKDAADEAIDEAADAVNDELEEEGQDILAAALGPDQLHRTPFGAFVEVDWSDSSQPPKWTPYLARVQAAGQQTGAAKIDSRELTLTGHGGEYRVSVRWEVRAIDGTGGAWY